MAASEAASFTQTSQAHLNLMVWLLAGFKPSSQELGDSWFPGAFVEAECFLPRWESAAGGMGNLQLGHFLSLQTF